MQNPWDFRQSEENPIFTLIEKKSFTSHGTISHYHYKLQVNLILHGKTKNRIDDRA